MKELKDSLIEQLEAIIELRKGSRPTDLPYAGQEDFVLKNGKVFTSQKYPEKYEKYRGEMKLCFTNAFDLSQRFPELTYVEGYGMSSNIPLAIHHAFCVDKKGNVVDPTWRDQEETAYFGVQFNQTYVANTILRTMHYGILDNYHEGNPLLTKESGHKRKDFSSK